MVFQPDEIKYFVVMWVLTFIAGTLRTFRDKDYGSVWNCLSVGSVGGFYGFAVVSICCYYGPNISDFGWPYIGISTAIGLLGKEQDKITRAIFLKFFAKVFRYDGSENFPKSE